eukprot:888707-Amphidinium_carterae.1
MDELECLKCPENTRRELPGASAVGECILCAEGYTSEPGSVACLKCGEGMIAAEGGEGAGCYACPPGTAARNGTRSVASSCDACPVG